MANCILKLSPPWVTFVNEINAMFGDDPEIGITFNSDKKEVKMYVENTEKAKALSLILPVKRNFGNVDLTINIVPANGWGDEVRWCMKIEDMYKTAFKDNPVFSFTHSVECIFSNTITYVVFKNRVVQFFNDNLGDVYGNVSTLYQDIALDLFGDLEGVRFCTDVEGKVGKPLGEWP